MSVVTEANTSRPYAATVPGSPTTDTSVIVPIKAFRSAKARLAGRLDAESRSNLARMMAERVLAAAAPLPVAVVCDDDEVACWTREMGGEVIWTPGLDLDGSVTAGVDSLGRRGIARAIVAHADLPFATDLAGLLSEPADVVLVPDRHHDGTNVIVVPTGGGFRFSYGPGSFVAHREEARRLDLRVVVVESEHLGWDVDRPADLDPPAHLGPVPGGPSDRTSPRRTTPLSGSVPTTGPPA